MENVGSKFYTLAITIELKATITFCFPQQNIFSLEYIFEEPSSSRESFQNKIKN